MAKMTPPDNVKLEMSAEEFRVMVKALRYSIYSSIFTPAEDQILDELIITFDPTGEYTN